MREPYGKSGSMSYPDFVSQFWQDIAGWAVLINIVLTLFTIACVLHLKREPMSAIAWCLTVIVLSNLAGAKLEDLVRAIAAQHIPGLADSEKKSDSKRDPS